MAKRILLIAIANYVLSGVIVAILQVSSYLYLAASTILFTVLILIVERKKLRKMKRFYVNVKGAKGLETIDEVCRADFDSAKAYKAELRNVIESYRQLGGSPYLSRRCTKEWRDGKRS